MFLSPFPLLLIATVVHTEHQDQLPYFGECPTWFLPVRDDGNIWCVCNGSTIQGGSVVRCPKRDRVCLTCEEQEVIDRDDLNISIPTGFSMTHNFSTQKSLLALCPYHPSPKSPDFFLTLPSNLTELNGFMCDHSARHGDLCSSCIDNAGQSMLSTSQKCYLNEPKTSWLFFLTVTLVPPTIFFFLVLFCSLRATTGPLNAFIFFSQMLYTVISMHFKTALDTFGVKDESNWNSAGDVVRSIIVTLIGSFYTFWDNQYLIYNTRLAVTKSITPIQVKALQYLPALYPLFLILLTYIIIRLHYNGCRVLVFMWRPFKHCKARLGITWDPMDSIIHTFATFILLVYTKVMEVSFTLLAPTRVYTETGELPYKILPFDASIHFLSRQHLPYFILALSMLTVFCGLPLLLLLLYPMKCFQNLLNKTVPSHVREVLRVFTEAFTGCYKDKTMPNQRLDCRYFASLYLLFRVVYLSCIFFVEHSHVWLSVVAFPLLLSSLFVLLQPYKLQWLNVLDSIFFILAALTTFLYVYHIYVTQIALWVPNLLLCVPFLYFVSFLSCKLYVKMKCCWARYQMGENATTRVSAAADEDQEFEGADENSLLINPIHTA